ncbi:hypothetical protein N0Y54_42070 [Nostoc punctiforme UO1]|uniref:hypothetical protein n=1 Tax=Nostoc punctiforme TaxID=272131 RepID=UPI00309A5A6E
MTTKDCIKGIRNKLVQRCQRRCGRATGKNGELGVSDRTFIFSKRVVHRQTPLARS